jgi:four helix bundle protein
VYDLLTVGCQNSLKALDIYNMAYDLAIEVHNASRKLPDFELYEQGSQVRRSSKRIKDTIAEGYGRRRYKMEYLKFLTYAIASCDETLSHTEMIKDLYPDIEEFKGLHEQYCILGKRINSYIQYVEKTGQFRNNRHPAPSTQYPVPSTQYPAPSTQYPAPSTQHPLSK